MNWFNEAEVALKTFARLFLSNPEKVLEEAPALIEKGADLVKSGEGVVNADLSTAAGAAKAQVERVQANLDNSMIGHMGLNLGPEFASNLVSDVMNIAISHAATVAKEAPKNSAS